MRDWLIVLVGWVWGIAVIGCKSSQLSSVPPQTPQRVQQEVSHVDAQNSQHIQQENSELVLVVSTRSPFPIGLTQLEK